MKYIYYPKKKQVVRFVEKVLLCLPKHSIFCNFEPFIEILQLLNQYPLWFFIPTLESKNTDMRI